ncbi:Uncharacterised protein [Mycobacteroides abscessus subsp. abscessus]|nr:Uncharacterised protein [Mycobacteroides abscessus subsp. abscessus]
MRYSSSESCSTVIGSASSKARTDIRSSITVVRVGSPARRAARSGAGNETGLPG